MRNKKRLAIGMAATGIAGSLALTSCSQQLDDLQGINPQYPDAAQIYMNVDNFPNVVLLCIKGAGFATTTRAYNAIIRVEKWDAFCAAQPAGGARGVTSLP